MVISQNSIQFKANWLLVCRFVLFLLPLGIANAEEEGKDWAGERREYEVRIDEFTREIKEHRNEGSDSWAKHLTDRRDYCKSMLPMLDQILETGARAQKGPGRARLRPGRTIQGQARSAGGQVRASRTHW